MNMSKTENPQILHAVVHAPWQEVPDQKDGVHARVLFLESDAFKLYWSEYWDKDIAYRALARDFMNIYHKNNEIERRLKANYIHFSTLMSQWEHERMGCDLSSFIGKVGNGIILLWIVPEHRLFDIIKKALSVVVSGTGEYDPELLKSDWKGGGQIKEDAFWFRNKYHELVKRAEATIDYCDKMLVLPYVVDMLLPHQKEHVQYMIASLEKWGVFLDKSQTGTGKTYCAVAAAASMKIRKMLVICPLAVVPAWNNVIRAWNSNVAEVEIRALCVNYEKVRLGKTAYCVRIDGESVEFEWSNLDADTMVVVDEAHKAKNKSQQGKCISALCEYAAEMSIKVAFLSATIADKPIHFRNIAGFLGLFHAGERDKFMRSIVDVAQEDKKSQVSMLHDMLKYCSGTMRLQDVSGIGSCEYSCQPVGMSHLDTDRVKAAYAVISDNNKKDLLDYIAGTDAFGSPVSTKGDNGKPVEVLSAITKCLKASEEIKAPYLCSEITRLLDDGFSVVVFVKFLSTIVNIKNYLSEHNIPIMTIVGDDKIEARQECIEKFSRDEIRVVLCTHQAGGVGISLHDTNGEHSRYALICPTFSAQDLHQSMGRVMRAGSKTKSIQKVIYVAGTYEEKVADVMSKKIKAIQTINEGKGNATMHKIFDGETITIERGKT